MIIKLKIIIFISENPDNFKLGFRGCLSPSINQTIFAF